ncbi:MAG: hypothetical protein SVO01_11430, partial [Thermotogota bacterium]|nr:hypothetical protein [Thermotogota bacterium]
MIVPSLYGADQIMQYGFEDWGGDIPNTPGYIFTSGYTEYCNEQANATEVVSSYDGWTPHSGRYFWLQNDSPCCALNPSVTGITAGDVQANNNIGAAGAQCGDDSLDISSDITTGEIFIRFWARHNGGFATVQDGGRCKWIFVATDVSAGVYMHLSTSSTSPSMY